MWTRNGRIRCDTCGLFCQPADQETPFGCYDAPEPYDPFHYCGKCAVALYEEHLKQFRDGNRYGMWQKSDAEVRAAKDCGLRWIGNTGIAIDKRNGRTVINEYVSAEDEPHLVGYSEYRRQERMCKTTTPRGERGSANGGDND